jgi:hypothetical protein
VATVKFAIRSMIVVAAPLLVAGAIAAVAPATAAAAAPATPAAVAPTTPAAVAPATAAAGMTSPGLAASFSVNGSLSGVAATSATNAWAVGETEASTPFKGVISHWNGSTWK